MAVVSSVYKNMIPHQSQHESWISSSHLLFLFLADALIYSAGPYGHVGDRTHNPYALFWLKEPTAGNWFKRSIFSDGVSRDLDHAEAEQWMHQKDRGFLFRIDVTGIKSGGRFLKGE